MIIDVTDLSLKLGKQSILQNINLTIKPGTFLGLLGPNGAGKSTFLRCLSGDYKHYQGSILLFGRDIKKWDTIRLAQKRAVMPQNQTVPFPYPSWKVVELGRFPFSGEKISQTRKIVQTSMELTSTLNLKDRSYSTLSGGEAQRIQMSRAFAQTWKTESDGIMYFDEPTSNLDPQHQHQALNLIKRTSRNGTTCICVLHDLNLAAAYCDQIALMKDGSIFQQGTSDHVLTAKTIKDVYNLETHIIRHPDRAGPIIVPINLGEHHDSRDQKQSVSF